ncbi:MAG: hypothetical protein IT348_10465 [Candidatus Eisenbacteria bacterium]|nr:hypothetical protein [Candidatus Eisenbacteria bacterium]
MQIAKRAWNRLTGANDPLKVFLSCSVRPGDAPLVRAVKAFVENRGFACYTVGREVTLPEQVDDAVRRLMSECECLIGVATERLNATDVAKPTSTLRLATPYLLQETAMAFQAEMPFQILRADGITLQGVTNRNLYIDIHPALSPKGLIRFKAKRVAVESSLADLKAKALALRKARLAGKVKDWIGAGAKVLATGTLGVLGYAGAKSLGRPQCFGDFYYRDPTCKSCTHKQDCKVRKLQMT